MSAGRVKCPGALRALEGGCGTQRGESGASRRAAQALNLAPPSRAGDVQQNGSSTIQDSVTDCQMGITNPTACSHCRSQGTVQARHLAYSLKVLAIFIINQKGGRNISEMMQPYEYIQSCWIFPM